MIHDDNIRVPIAGQAPSCYDPGLGRVRTIVAQALFSSEDWLSTSDIAVVTALQAASDNTRIAWASDWAVFRAWVNGPGSRAFPDERMRVRLPVLPEVLVAFIRDMRAGVDGEPARAIATVRRYLSTLSTLHRLLNVPDPTKLMVIRNAVKAAARRSGGQRQAAPFRWADVLEAVRVLPDSLGGQRDKALLAVGHNTMARRSELVALDVADVEFSEGSANGAPDGLVMLRPTKSQIEAEPEPRFLGPEAAALLSAWLTLSELTEGPLFPAILRGNQARMSNGERGAARILLPYGRRLDPQEVNLIIKRAVAAIAQARGELTLPDEAKARRSAIRAFAKEYSGHSLRVGAAQDLAAAGVSTAAILQAGGWSDERMIKRYLRKLAAREGGMAQFFAQDCEDSSRR